MYESKCLKCNPGEPSKGLDEKENIRKGIYIGETSRSIHERAVEHVINAKTFSHKSHIIKHWVRDHPDMVEPPARVQV